jgi:hypothetical protein
LQEQGASESSTEEEIDEPDAVIETDKDIESHSTPETVAESNSHTNVPNSANYGWSIPSLACNPCCNAYNKLEEDSAGVAQVSPI